MDDLIKGKDLIIGLLKGLMQPMFSVLAAGIVVRLLLTGFDQNILFWLAAGVVGFWFGKTVGLFGDGKITAAANTGLMQLAKSQQNTISNAALDLGASVPITYVEGKAVVNPAVNVTKADDDNPDAYLAELIADLETDPGVK